MGKFVDKISTLPILSKLLGSFYLVLRSFYTGMKINEFRNQYDIDSSFKFNGQGTIFYGAGKIKIGKNSYIGRNCALSAAKGTTITIGENCAISHYVFMYSGSRVSVQDFSKLPHKQIYGDITIGDNCWIGKGVFIVHGVRIGKNCVVGANSVVTKDIPDYSIAAGSPAKVIKTINIDV
jgi:maltose O-acetyltransferase